MNKEILLKNYDTLTIGGGCFWCMETLFMRLKGVDSVLSGYSGGSIKNPSYKEVCNGNTGHAEVVQIVYNPDVISISELFDVFFHLHNPTTLNRQGEDIGSQYRSVIFYRNDSQKNAAENAIKKISEEQLWSDKIVTSLEPFEEFFVAEDYHQNYFNQNSTQPYCSAVIGPKVKKLMENYKDKIK